VPLIFFGWGIKPTNDAATDRNAGVFKTAKSQNPTRKFKGNSLSIHVEDITSESGSQYEAQTRLQMRDTDFVFGASVIHKGFSFLPLIE
jgi:hypothetical protein